MCDCQKALCVHAEEINALGIVVHATEAAKSHVAYSRALDGARRAEMLIGDGAGRERAWNAEQHFLSRTVSLQRLAEALEDFKASAESSHISRANELLARGAASALLVNARHTAIAALLESDVSADAAGASLAALLENASAQHCHVHHSCA